MLLKDLLPSLFLADHVKFGEGKPTRTPALVLRSHLIHVLPTQGWFTSSSGSGPAEGPQSSWRVLSPAHAAAEPPRYLNHGVDAQMPNTLNWKNEVLEKLFLEAVSSWCSAAGGLTPNLSPAVGSFLAAPSPLPATAGPGSVPLAQHRRGSPSAGHFGGNLNPLSHLQQLFPVSYLPAYVVFANCIILYMTSGFQSCSILTTVFPCVYINLNKHN